MLYSRIMKTSSPEVAEAIERRVRKFSEDIAKAQVWMTEKGASAMAGKNAFGSYRVIALVFDDSASVPEGWRKHPQVRMGFVPPSGSEAEDEMLVVTCDLVAIPGLPQSFVGNSPARGRTAGSPELFTQDGVSYMCLAFDPDSYQDEAPQDDASWEDCSEHEFNSARIAHAGRINNAKRGR